MKITLLYGQYQLEPVLVYCVRMFLMNLNGCCCERQHLNTVNVYMK